MRPDSNLEEPMTTVSAPNRLALPPPLRLDLVDDERAVGWIDDNTIAFRGFVDETEAAHAAWVAYRTIARRRARTHGTRPLPIDVEPLALRRVDDGEAILTSTRRIATLLRPGVESRSRDDSFGFAIALPEPASEPEVRAMADLAYRTVRKSGVRWALWRRRDAGPQAHANADPATDVVAEREAGKRRGRERARRRRWSLPNVAPRQVPAMLRW
jgi:hypothetical protein